MKVGAWTLKKTQCDRNRKKTVHLSDIASFSLLFFYVVETFNVKI